MKKFLLLCLIPAIVCTSLLVGCESSLTIDPADTVNPVATTESTEAAEPVETTEITEMTEYVAAEPRFVEQLPVAMATPYSRYLESPTGGHWWLRPYGFVHGTWHAVIPGYGFDKDSQKASFLWTFSNVSPYATLGDIYLEMIDSSYERSKVEFVIDKLTYYTSVEGGYLEHDIQPTQSLYSLEMHTGKANFIIGNIGNMPLGEVAAIFVKVRYVGEMPDE